MPETTDASLMFHHKNNITCGKGRVLWARGCTDASGNAHHEGWVLPGGARTQDERVATAAALLLDDLSR
jgi:hypothetical protein